MKFILRNTTSYFKQNLTFWPIHRIVGLVLIFYLQKDVSGLCIIEGMNDKLVVMLSPPQENYELPFHSLGERSSRKSRLFSHFKNGTLELVNAASPKRVPSRAFWVVLCNKSSHR